MMKYLSLAIAIIALCFVNAKAAEVYKHIPFTLTLKPGDVLTVDYDFSGKNGIRCTTDGKARIDFLYKGHQKSAYLPVTLQSSHVPLKEDEVLADYSGQFSLVLGADEAENKQYNISCIYQE